MSARIVVPDDFPAVFTGSGAAIVLRSLGRVDLFTERGAEREDELIRRLGNAEIALTLRAYSKFTERVLAACPVLRMISVWGTGTDNVDLDACAARGIAVTNTPGVNAHAVAEHTMALLLAVLRAIPAMDAAAKRGEWPRRLLSQLEGRTLGLVGLGAIGRRVAALAAPFGVPLLAWTARPDDGRAAAAGARHVSLDTLLRESDVVSLHLRLTTETRGLIGARELEAMKPTAVLVNTARAALVDRTALVHALERGGIAGAGLDVFHQEPVAPDDPLLALPNVVLTPHNAGFTADVIAAGLRAAVANVEQFLFRD